MRQSHLDTPSRLADLLLAAVVSGLVLALAHFWGGLSSPWVVNDDVRQQVFWMQQWQDPGLFPGDPLSAYAREYVPWGSRAVYRLAAHFISPLYFSKLLPPLLFALLGASLFSAAHRLGGRSAAWGAAALLWTTTLFTPEMAGGLSRSFAAPLLALFLSCRLAGRGAGMALVLLAQALFIPYVFPVCAGAVLLEWAWLRLGKGGQPPPFPGPAWHWLALGLAALVIWLYLRALEQGGFGPLVGLEGMAGRPEFGPQGRSPILPPPSLAWELVRPWGGIGPFREAGPVAGVIVALTLVAGALGGWFRLGRHGLAPWTPLGALLASSLVCYLLARAWMLKLSIPDRYLIYSLALGYCLLLARGWSVWLDALAIKKWAAALLVGLAAIAGAARSHGLELYDYSQGRPLYAALEATPKDCLVAGHPFLMDNVLTFARRPVLASFELAHCWHVGLWRQVEPRLRQMLLAYYSDDPSDLQELARRWGVCFLAVDRRHFTPAFLDDRPMFAPYDELIRRAAASGSFAVLQGGFCPALPVDDNLFILDLRAWRGPALAHGEPGR